MLTAFHMVVVHNLLSSPTSGQICEWPICWDAGVSIVILNSWWQQWVSYSCAAQAYGFVQPNCNFETLRFIFSIDVVLRRCVPRAWKPAGQRCVDGQTFYDSCFSAGDPLCRGEEPEGVEGRACFCQSDLCNDYFVERELVGE